MMPTAVATPKTKATKLDFFERLEQHNKADIQGALTQYRALAEELSRDANYEFDPDLAGEILATLKATSVDLRHDAETLAAMRTNEALLMTAERHQESITKGKEASDKAAAYLAEVPKLKGIARAEEHKRSGDGLIRGEINRTKAAHLRLWGDPAAVQVRLEQGLPTAPGPRPSGAIKTGTATASVPRSQVEHAKANPAAWGA